MSAWISANKELLTLWIGAICTLGLYTVLYKENKIYRLFEHIFLGLATGYLVVNTWNETLMPKWWTPFWEKGEWWWVLTLVAGLLYYFIYSRKYNWMARLVIGFFLGVGSGQTFQGFVNDLWPQIVTSFKPLIPHPMIPEAAGHPAIKEVTMATAINNFIFMVTLLCVMSYFFFSFEQKNPILKGSAKWGRWLMMFTFGAIFGSTIMARLALLIDRMNFLLNDFGSKVAEKAGGPVTMFVVVIALTILLLILATLQNRRAAEEAE